MYQNINEMIEDSSRQYGYRTFAIDPEDKISFHTVNEVSTSNAKKILSLTERKETGYPIAVFGEKSIRLLTMMFSCMKAGAFYVVLNPEQPVERLNTILKVLEPALLIYDDALADTVNKLSFNNKSVSFAQLEKQREGQIDLPVLSREDPLYGIFTSGSTGIPKCVVISHGDVLDFISHFVSVFQFDDHDIIGNQAPFDFDVSVKDIYTALWCGASLLLIPREYFSTPPRLIDYICDHQVTSLTWAVSALCIISGLKGFQYRIPQSIKRVMFSGEMMPVKQLKIWQKYIPDAMYVNLYGPTEITCNCMYYMVPNPYLSDHDLPLGLPFAGRTVTIRDENNHLLNTPGNQGEICVSGESLAIGYYHDKEQTDKAFRIENGVRTYHTGDNAIIGSDGNWYFAGRTDFQIKHMGHRIELEEIEKAVESEDGVSRCICTYDHVHNLIAAFYTGEVHKKQLHIELKKKLPQYMIPNHFYHVCHFSLNKNGKTDRNKLMGLKMAEE